MVGLKKMLRKRGIYVSIAPTPHGSGGGANTFSWNFCRYLEKRDIKQERNILLAKKALVIANKVDYFSLWLAKKNGCFIVHRLDEHFQDNESRERRRRHEQVVKINRLADVTVFQSQFVQENVLPHLKPSRYAVILNGADPEIFYDRGSNQRCYVGHITNSVGWKKRLDILEKAIKDFPSERFLLIGNHGSAEIDFSRYANVTMVGPVSKKELALYHQQMKCLYFPSENDPCPNTVVEAILSGVPVCYNQLGGTREIVGDCGLPLEKFGDFLARLPEFKSMCARREDLYFDKVMEKYLKFFEEEGGK